MDDDEAAEELEGCLADIERCQEAIRKATQRLDALLNHSESAREWWSEFQRSGGITYGDFIQFQRGTFRSRILRTKGKLRLVASRQPVRIKLKERPITEKKLKKGRRRN
jgi:hypothetical protein